MAFTNYPVNDALAAKLWSKTLSVEANKASDIGPLFGTGDNAVIQIKTETQKSSGDRITFGLRMQLNGKGFTSGQVAEGNGEQLSTNSDAVTIDELGNVVGIPSKNTIDAQRVPFNLREQASDGLSDWFKLRKSVTFFNQVCGFTPANVDGLVIGANPAGGVQYNGNNTITAPSTGRIVRPNGLTTDAAVAAATTGAIMTLGLIDTTVEIAKTGGSAGNVMMRPVDVPGYGKMWILFLHSTQVTQLRTNTATGQWLDIQKAAMAGMASAKSPIFTGALGVYNNVVLRESQQVTMGVATNGTGVVANVRRAVLLGAQAAVCAFGKGGGQNTYRWNEELYDHKRRFEVSAWKIWGLKKTTYNGADFAAIVCPTYAVDAA